MQGQLIQYYTESWSELELVGLWLEGDCWLGWNSKATEVLVLGRGIYRCWESFWNIPGPHSCWGDCLHSCWHHPVWALSPLLSSRNCPGGMQIWWGGNCESTVSLSPHEIISVAGLGKLQVVFAFFHLHMGSPPLAGLGICKLYLHPSTFTWGPLLLLALVSTLTHIWTHI